MDFPSEKRHRRNRRRLGRGQYPTAAAVGVAVTGLGSDVTITCSAPVVCTGPISFSVPTRAITSQTQTAPSIITLTMNGAIAGLAWAMPNVQPNLKSTVGAPVTGGNGLFIGTPPATCDVLSVANNLDGSYTVTWSETVTITGGDPNEPDLLFWNATNNVWSHAVLVGQSAADATIYFIDPSAADASTFVIVGTPLKVSAADPINVMQGPIPIA